MIRAVFFDLDETLTDSRDAILDWWRGYWEALGQPFPPAERQHLMYTLPQEEIVAAFELGAPGEAVYARYLKSVGVGNTVSGIRLKPGAKDVLDFCRARYRLALGTNRSAQLTTLLEHLGIHDYFEVIVSGETAPHFKPHPWGVHHVRERLALDATDVVFVGDSPADIAFAVNGGIRSIGLGDSWRRGPHVPTWQIADIAELPALLATIV